MAKPRLSDVLDTIAAAVKNALVAANLSGTAARGRVEVGWPNPNYLGKRMKALNPLVTVFATARSSDSSAYIGMQTYTIFPEPTLFAVSEYGTITLSGSVTPGLNVHVFTVFPEADGYFATIAGDTLESVAQKIAEAINGLDYPNVTAVATDETIAVTNAPNLAVNIGTTGQGVTEIGRRSQDVQVSVWAPDDATREAISDAIVSSLGTEQTRSLTLSDGTDLDIKFKSGPSLSDSMEDNLTTYVAHIVFVADYGVLAYTTATQIGSAITGLSLDSGPTSLSYDSGE